MTSRSIMQLAYNDHRVLDLHLAGQPNRPLVLCIHGGGFVSGSRDDARCSQAVSILVTAGFNIASIEYTLARPDDRFGAWPRNLLDVADAMDWLQANAGTYGYLQDAIGMLGFSAGCCLGNLYIQGGRDLLDHFGYATPVYPVAALAGFYGPYDFSSRQADRKSTDDELNRLHSPAYWVARNPGRRRPPVLHVQGDRDEIVYPDQHSRFESDYRESGLSFEGIVAHGFGHSFAPRDRNASGEAIDLGPALVTFFERHLVGD